jgi:hypothetical protein
MPDYKPDYTCIGGPKDYSCVRTVGQAFRDLNGAAVTSVTMGVPLCGDDVSGIPAAVVAAKAADVVVLLLGSGVEYEDETKDRDVLTVSPAQLALATAIVQLGIPCVLVLIHGGPLAIEGPLQGFSALTCFFFFFPSNICVSISRNCDDSNDNRVSCVRPLSCLT